jgi:hypothetical protein
MHRAAYSPDEAFGEISCWIAYAVPSYQFTAYFESEVMRKRPYLTKGMCTRVFGSPVPAQSTQRVKPHELLRMNALRLKASSDSLRPAYSFSFDNPQRSMPSRSRANLVRPAPPRPFSAKREHLRRPLYNL